MNQIRKETEAYERISSAIRGMRETFRAMGMSMGRAARNINLTFRYDVPIARRRRMLVHFSGAPNTRKRRKLRKRFKRELHSLRRARHNFLS